MIAIHTESGAFAKEWVAYCNENNVPYKEVNCLSTDIIDDLRDCRALLWHWPHHDFRAQLFARQLIKSVEKMGLHVFPNTSTCWHYDDKVGQKYLLEAVNAPIIPSYVFYDKESALEWIEKATLPIVWKLRGGAGSRNVHLVRNLKKARHIIKKSFDSGWSFSRYDVIRERVWHFRRMRDFHSFMKIPRALWWTIFPNEETRNTPIEKNYVYFQEFIPGCSFDIRVVVIGKRCYAFRRSVRAGDFRASGSGIMDHSPEKIPTSCIKAAFEVSEKLNLQSGAYDFVLQDGLCQIVEVSYAFALVGYKRCPGYWDQALKWYDRPVQPERFIIEDVLSTLAIKV